MKLSTKGRYAMVALADLALQSQGALVNLTEISKRQDISLPYLEQLFVKLRRAGLVESVRGPGGGYRLAKAAADIRDTLTTIGFDLWHPAMDDADTLLAGLEEFREHLGGRLTITLIEGVGKPVDVHTIDRDTMAAALGRLREAHAGVSPYV